MASTHTAPDDPVKPSNFRAVFSVLSVLVTCGSCASIQPDYFEIHGLTQGKVKTVAGNSVIYELGNRIIYNENGYCTKARKIYSCMKFGLKISYETNQSEIVLDCLTQFYEAFGYARQKPIPNETDEGRFQVVLDGHRTEYVEGASMVIPSGDFKPSRSETYCSFKGKEVFRYTWEILAAMEPAAQLEVKR